MQHEETFTIEQAQQYAVEGATLRTELLHTVLDDCGCILDGLIGFAFDTLGVDVLDLRILPNASSGTQNLIGLACHVSNASMGMHEGQVTNGCVNLRDF